MSKLFIFTDPVEASATLTLDNGTELQAIPDLHPSGRWGKSFTIPEGSPNGNGAKLSITADGKVPVNQRGIVWINSESSVFQVDDFYLEDT